MARSRGRTRGLELATEVVLAPGVEGVLASCSGDKGAGTGMSVRTAGVIAGVPRAAFPGDRMAFVKSDTDRRRRLFGRSKFMCIGAVPLETPLVDDRSEMSGSLCVS